MNSTYPNTSSDFDEQFLTILLRAVFSKEDLKMSGQLSTIKNLNRAKLQLVKCSVEFFFFVCMKKKTL